MIRQSLEKRLFEMIQSEQIEEIEKLLNEYEVDLAKKTIGRFYADAIADGKEKVVSYFIGKGFNINEPVRFQDDFAYLKITDEEMIIGDYPINIAIENNQFDMVKFLLEKGANPNVVDDFGESPLYKSVIKGNQEVVEILVSHGADINIVEKMNGFTPLIAGVYNKQYHIVEYLLKNKADGSIRSYDKSPIQYMLELDTTEEKERMLDIFIQHKYQFDEKDQKYINQIRLKRIFELPEEEEDF